MISPQNQARAGGLLLAVGVACGAFGAHGLKHLLQPEMMAIYEKGVFYHLIHALGILVVSLLGKTELISAKKNNFIFLCLAAGIIIFSGSLYLLAITGTMWLGAVTPIGGVLFILSWLRLAI